LKAGKSKIKASEDLEFGEGPLPGSYIANCLLAITSPYRRLEEFPAVLL
jgi:hypothetical protein